MTHHRSCTRDDASSVRHYAPGGCRYALVEALDHHVGGLDESGGGVAFLQLQLAHCVGGDDGGDVAVDEGEDDLGEEAFDADTYDFARELVPAADAAVAF